MVQERRRVESAAAAQAENLQDSHAVFGVCARCFCVYVCVCVCVRFWWPGRGTRGEGSEGRARARRMVKDGIMFGCALPVSSSPLSHFLNLGEERKGPCREVDGVSHEGGVKQRMNIW